jgi:hypothetical protein
MRLALKRSRVVYARGRAPQLTAMVASKTGSPVSGLSMWTRPRTGGREQASLRSMYAPEHRGVPDRESRDPPRMVCDDAGVDPITDTLKAWIGAFLANVNEKAREHRDGQRKALGELETILDTVDRVEHDRHLTDEQMMDMVGKAQARLARLGSQLDDKRAREGVASLREGITGDDGSADVRALVTAAREAVGRALRRL